MPDANDLTPGGDLTPLTRALRELAPAPGGLSRDALLFEAGRAAAAPGCAWLWPVTAGGFALLSVVFAALAFQGPRTLIVHRDRPVEVRVEVPVPVQAEVPESPAPEPAPAVAAARSEEDERAADVRRMAELRRDVLRWGVEMLPEPRTAAAPRAPRDGDIPDRVRPTPGAYASPYSFGFRLPSIRFGEDE